MKTDSQIQELYTRRASFYERLFVGFLGWGRELEIFFRGSDYLRPGLKILDAGCGTGVISRVLYKLGLERGCQGIRFHAFDLTRNMLEIFRQWVAEQEANNIELEQADVLEIETLPQDWKGYDLIVISTMLEYLPGNKVKQALANLRQLLKEEGILLALITRRNIVTRWLATNWWKTNVYAQREIQSLFHAVSFAEIQFKKFTPRWSGSIMVIQAEK